MNRKQKSKTTPSKLSQRKAQISLLIIISLVVSLGVFAFAEFKFNITGFAIGENVNVLEATSQIEVWANTSLEFLDEEDSVLLKLDDGTPLNNEEIEFYQNGNLIGIENTDENGKVNAPFNPYETSPGVTSEIRFQGVSNLYLNPSSLKFGGESVGENNGDLVKDEEITSNVQNIFSNPLEGFNCREFRENVLWSSGYSLLSDSVKYLTW